MAKRNSGKTASKAGAKKAGTKKAGTKKAGAKKAGTKKVGTKKAGTKKAGAKKAGAKQAAGGARGEAVRSAFEPRIVAFACNWCSYPAADAAGINKMQYPPNARIIRVMCAGRIHPAFVLRALELGADGVLVSGCHDADCHYLFGAKRAAEQFEKTAELVRMLGLEKERVRFEQISAAEAPMRKALPSSVPERFVDLNLDAFERGYERGLAALGKLPAGGEAAARKKAAPRKAAVKKAAKKKTAKKKAAPKKKAASKKATTRRKRATKK